MRLPYLQLAEKFITVQSKMVARMLGIKRKEVIGMGALLFESVLELTSSDEAPPSGVITGEDAADIIEAGMEWDGERGKAFGAFVRADVIERTEAGARVKGCDRYKDAWGKQQRRKDGMAQHLGDPEKKAARVEHARLAAQARWDFPPKNAQPMPENAPSMLKDAQPMLNACSADAQNAPKTETETETETDKKPLPKPAAAVSNIPEPEEFEADSEGEFKPTAWGFWGWHNQERQERELFDEPTPPHKMKAWHDAAQAKVGIPALILAYQRYLEDMDFSDKGWPFAVFTSEAVWLPRANAPPDAPPKGRAFT